MTAGDHDVAFVGGGLAATLLLNGLRTAFPRLSELERDGEEAIASVKDMAGVECEEILTSGRPHRAIIRVSDEVGADLIVVGSTGMTSLERAVIGSESESLMRLSKRPVLIVHEA